MRIKNSDDAYKLSLIQLGGTDIDIISSSIAIQNLLIIHVLKEGGDKNKLKELLVAINGRNVSDKYIDKIIEQTKGIVMI